MRGGRRPNGWWTSDCQPCVSVRVRMRMRVGVRVGVRACVCRRVLNVML